MIKIPFDIQNKKRNIFRGNVISFKLSIQWSTLKFQSTAYLVLFQFIWYGELLVNYSFHPLLACYSEPYQIWLRHLLFHQTTTRHAKKPLGKNQFSHLTRLSSATLFIAFLCTAAGLTKKYHQTWFTTYITPYLHVNTTVVLFFSCICMSLATAFIITIGLSQTCHSAKTLTGSCELVFNTGVLDKNSVSTRSVPLFSSFIAFSWIAFIVWIIALFRHVLIRRQVYHQPNSVRK